VIASVWIVVFAQVALKAATAPSPAGARDAVHAGGPGPLRLPVIDTLFIAWATA
jgi:hypothetical protein